jgi:hypothetical protein
MGSKLLPVLGAYISRANPADYQQVNDESTGVCFSQLRITDFNQHNVY